MAFYHKIILAALAVTAVAAGAGFLSAEPTAPVVADPGWWLALGEGLIGVSENGWCSCL